MCITYACSSSCCSRTHVQDTNIIYTSQPTCCARPKACKLNSARSVRQGCHQPAAPDRQRLCILRRKCKCRPPAATDQQHVQHAPRMSSCCCAGAAACTACAANVMACICCTHPATCKRTTACHICCTRPAACNARNKDHQIAAQHAKCAPQCLSPAACTACAANVTNLLQPPRACRSRTTDVNHLLHPPSSVHIARHFSSTCAAHAGQHTSAPQMI